MALAGVIHVDPLGLQITNVLRFLRGQAFLDEIESAALVMGRLNALQQVSGWQVQLARQQVGIE